MTKSQGRLSRSLGGNTGGHVRSTASVLMKASIKGIPVTNFAGRARVNPRVWLARSGVVGVDTSCIDAAFAFALVGAASNNLVLDISHTVRVALACSCYISISANPSAHRVEFSLS